MNKTRVHVSTIDVAAEVDRRMATIEMELDSIRLSNGGKVAEELNAQTIFMLEALGYVVDPESGTSCALEVA